jgi:MinD superfamily P-loop ATPase
MKQLLILSGKGGTGKTTIASAFIKLLGAAAYADCDVDAPNLHLITGQHTEPERTDYFGLPKASIDRGQCIECGQCRQSCRFGAISANDGYTVDPFACEGCGVCAAVCTAKAISLIPAVAGELMLYADEGRAFSTAQLKTGSGASGKLVAEVKKRLRLAASDAEYAIIDGSPGIGCPVIASLSGVDMVLIVAEPSISGISDMGRIIKTAVKFGIRTVICINKYDTNIKNADEIEDICIKLGLPFAGRIPFDPHVVEAINGGQTVVEIDCVSGRAIKEVFDKTMKLLDEEG